MNCPGMVWPHDQDGGSSRDLAALVVLLVGGIAEHRSETGSGRRWLQYVMTWAGLGSCEELVHDFGACGDDWSQFAAVDDLGGPGGGVSD